MDGNSTDNSIEKIRKFENRLSFWEIKTDKGQSHAINKGLEKCSGKIFNWIGSDDYLEPGALDEVRKIFLDDTIRVVSGKVRIINSNQNDDQHLLDGILLDESVEKTFARTSMTQPVTFWRLDDIKKFGLLNERLHYLMDLELWLKYLLSYGSSGVMKSDHVLANYRIHSGSKTFKEMDNSKIKPCSAFNIEKNNMFLFLSKKYGLSAKIKAVIRKLMDTVDEEYTMENIPDHPTLNVCKAINYYLYDFLRRHYYEGDLRIAIEIASAIESIELDAEERQGLAYLRRKLYVKKLFGKL